MTESELLAAMEELAATVQPEAGIPPNHWTTEGLLQNTSVSKGQYYEMLHAIQRLGRLGAVKVAKLTVDGRRGKTTAYCILPEKAE